jgi:acyl-CoA thioesterase-1
VIGLSIIRRSRRLRAVLCVACLVAVNGCGGSDDSREKAARPTAPQVTPSTGSAGLEAAAPVRRANLPRIVALGDSLTAGLGLAQDEAYPALLQKRLDAAGLPYQVVNAGVSGDTSAGGLSRLDWALDGDVRILIVALGGNDALRGLPAEELRRNLTTIIERAQARQIDVVLAGMEAPPNFGRAYIAAFHQVYPDLARQYHVAFVPFLLQNVAGIESLNQRDGIHPTADGARLVADNIWKVLKPMLKGA